MNHLSDTDFSRKLMAIAGEPEPFTPHATYDQDGDCVEFFAKPDPFYAKRVDDLVTVYYNQDTDEVVGALIKGVERFCKKVLSRLPGFRIDIEGGDVKLACLFRAQAWVSDLEPDDVPSITYKALIEAAEESGVKTKLKMCGVG